MRLDWAVRLSFYLPFLLVTITHATVITSSQLQSSYDFVIIGGGTAGNVLANRLTENANNQVLLLEAGQSEEGVVPVEIPFLCGTVTPNTAYDWNYTTISQPGLNGRTIPYPRGYILGGSSSANYLMYTRGSAADFDKFANITGDKGWAWGNMINYFKKSEKWSLPADGHNITGQFNPNVHGYTGILNVSLAGHPSNIDSTVFQAAAELGSPYQFNLDMNSGNELGIGWIQATVDGASRSSSATSYLNPATFRQRRNLSVLLGARVSRILRTGTISGVPVLRGVEFSIGSGASLQNVTAKKEVILSAGSIGTPHILLNSGIGNARSLTTLGIKSLVDLPDVGANMADHPFIANPWNANTTTSFDTFFQETDVQNQHINQWFTSGQGLVVDTVSSQLGFFRIPNNDSIWSSNRDPSSGMTTPHYEMLFSDGYPTLSPPPSGNYMGIGTVVLTPTSRGSVKLASNNPFSAPVIDPGLLETQFDKLVMREAIKSAKAFLTAPAFRGYILDQALAFAEVNTDDEIDAYVAAHAGTIFHPTGTAAMSANGSSTGVTNPDLTVKKVSGLRVVDASVFPFIPSGHLQAPIYAFAERASDLIKAKYD